MRLWDGRNGTCLAVLEGHTGKIHGALVLVDGRLLSWSEDHTLRLWDGRNGTCLAVLEGHTGRIRGALVLVDGRLLSWSEDRTLRLWDGHSGVSLAVIEGDTRWVKGALVLGDDRLVYWSDDTALRLWDGRSGTCPSVLTEDQAARSHPEWLHVREKAEKPEKVSLGFFLNGPACTAQLRHVALPSPVAVWHAESHSHARCLLPDGSTIVTQRNGQVCILKLHLGRQRVDLAELQRQPGSDKDQTNES